MGRRKIQIAPITEDRNRSVTFLKRKNGLFKKAYELGVLCSCDVAIIVFGHNSKLYEFASSDMDGILLRYSRYDQQSHERRGPADFSAAAAANNKVVAAARAAAAGLPSQDDDEEEDEDDDGSEDVEGRASTHPRTTPAAGSVPPSVPPKSKGRAPSQSAAPPTSHPSETPGQASLAALANLMTTLPGHAQPYLVPAALPGMQAAPGVPPTAGGPHFAYPGAVPGHPPQHNLPGTAPPYYGLVSGYPAYGPAYGHPPPPPHVAQYPGYPYYAQPGQAPPQSPATPYSAPTADNAAVSYAVPHAGHHTGTTQYTSHPSYPLSHYPAQHSPEYSRPRTDSSSSRPPSFSGHSRSAAGDAARSLQVLGQAAGLVSRESAPSSQRPINGLPGSHRAASAGVSVDQARTTSAVDATRSQSVAAEMGRTTSGPSADVIANMPSPSFFDGNAFSEFDFGGGSEDREKAKAGDRSGAHTAATSAATSIDHSDFQWPSFGLDLSGAEKRREKRKSRDADADGADGDVKRSRGPEADHVLI